MKKNKFFDEEISCFSFTDFISCNLNATALNDSEVLVLTIGKNGLKVLKKL